MFNSILDLIALLETERLIFLMINRGGEVVFVTNTTFVIHSTELFIDPCVASLVFDLVWMTMFYHQSNLSPTNPFQKHSCYNDLKILNYSGTVLKKWDKHYILIYDQKYNRLFRIKRSFRRNNTYAMLLPLIPQIYRCYDI